MATKLERMAEARLIPPQSLLREVIERNSSLAAAARHFQVSEVTLNKWLDSYEMAAQRRMVVVGKDAQVS